MYVHRSVKVKKSTILVALKTSYPDSDCADIPKDAQAVTEGDAINFFWGRDE